MSAISNYATILGTRIDNVDWTAIDQFCERALQNDEPSQIVTINGEFILRAQHDQRFKEIINHADLVIPDATNVVWISRLKGQPLKQVTPGSTLTLHLCQLAQLHHKSIYLLGGWNGVPEKAAKKLLQDYPNLEIAGWSENNPDITTTAEEIKRSGANIVLVAYGAPNQEYWIETYKKATGAQLLVGVGGTFNMLAGTLPRAPRFLQALHLEWLWRFLLEPHRRWKRVWNSVVVFPLKALFGN